MGKRLTKEERDAHRVMRQCRDLLLDKMEGFEDPSIFPLEDARRAIAHAYSIVARYEQEYKDTPTEEYFDEIINSVENATSEVDEKTVVMSQYEYDRMIKALEREKARDKRITILKDMTKANRILAQQMSENAKIDELQKRSKYIEIQQHAAVLGALRDITILALRRMGLSEMDIAEFYNHLKNLERDYPLVQMDKDEILKRLTGNPEPREIEAKSRVIEESPYEKLEEMDDLL